MYPFIRLLTTIRKASKAPGIPVDGISENSFRCMPWDLDLFMEMNNGRVLTLYDLGRFTLSIQSGLAKVLKEQNWGLVVAGSTTRYRKRVRMFDKVTMYTQVAAMDERWIYIIQSMWVKGEPASSVLLRTAITEKGRMIATERVKKAMNREDWHREPEGWVKAWIDSEDLRPWPPLQS
ncbi:acyl-CoA thioesterase [Endozoicomonas arenosclerae]|uniref:acyl-CoA thioesterase n=1 Tax=Endozoicomonas arenosclerae TaxID=1633495 RepID=UPI000785B59B|nr:acyl-CoA thioesterase [Endozoicomonas arenosclerae]